MARRAKEVSEPEQFRVGETIEIWRGTGRNLRMLGKATIRSIDHKNRTLFFAEPIRFGMKIGDLIIHSSWRRENANA